MKNDNCKIKLLDEITIGRMAAGEVIDRPVSIVKELIENSLDAASSLITIRLENGGNTLIQVTDNGIGMSKQDIVLAPVAHATSKIRSIRDLNEVGSFGFRGEALSSIAFVSKCVIQSSQDNRTGSEISVINNHVSEPVPCTHNTGTSVAVHDLFYNLPVRKNMLKSPNTELSHIVELVQSFSIIHNSINFILLNNNKELINTRLMPNLKSRLSRFWNIKNMDNLIFFDEKINDISFKGVLSKPDLTFPHRKKQLLSINKRVIKSPLILKAFQVAYTDLIPNRTFPLFVCNIEMDPLSHDVNVHPQKLDVKFTNHQPIFDAVSKLIKLKINDSPQFFPTNMQSKSAQIVNNLKHNQTIGAESDFKFEANSIPNNPLDTNFTEFINQHKLPYEINNEIELSYFQLFNTYIGVPWSDGLYIMDQHAVHERVLYEKFKERALKNNISQPLLIAETIHLSKSEFMIYQESKTIISDLNFIVEHFGDHTLKIREIPIMFEKINVLEWIQCFLSDYATHESNIESKTNSLKSILEMKACKAAIKAGQTLSQVEIKSLIRQMIESPNNYTCPHGRPLVLHFDKNKLETLFLRR